MDKLFLFFLVLFLSSCSKTTADFIIRPSNNTVPLYLNASNKSGETDSLKWYVNGLPVSKDLDLGHQFIRSGRHTIELKVYKKGKVSTKSKEIILQAPITCYILMRTNFGDMVFSLNEQTPIHRDNFIELIESSYYDNIRFHRVIDGFMIQAGDQKTRTPFKHVNHKEVIQQEIIPALIHKRGALAAARMPDDINPDKNSSGSQFYIVDGKKLTEKEIEKYESSKLQDYTKVQKVEYLEFGGSPQLDGEYTVFGQLLHGFNTLEKISQVKTNRKDYPETEVIILSIESIN